MLLGEGFLWCFFLLLLAFIVLVPSVCVLEKNIGDASMRAWDLGGCPWGQPLRVEGIVGLARYVCSYIACYHAVCRCICILCQLVTLVKCRHAR